MANDSFLAATTNLKTELGCRSIQGSVLFLSSAGIALVQITEDRLSADVTIVFDLAKLRGLAVERQVRPGVIVILDIFFDDTE
ncbi:MAG: hypothetical protein ACI97A_002712 [Planctomycetota bacterium]|jgi:hypothetical protein